MNFFQCHFSRLSWNIASACQELILNTHVCSTELVVTECLIAVMHLFSQKMVEAVAIIISILSQLRKSRCSDVQMHLGSGGDGLGF